MVQAIRSVFLHQWIFLIFQMKKAIAERMNKVVEKEILKGVEQYMWLHRRFKTRPTEDEPSLYS